MDSNCHCLIYGLETNSKGKKTEEFLADTAFEVEKIVSENRRMGIFMPHTDLGFMICPNFKSFETS